MKPNTTQSSTNSTGVIKEAVQRLAHELGFDLVRITSAAEFDRDRAAALNRIRSGLMAGLPWYTEARVRRGASPQDLLPGARSIICLGLNYYQADQNEQAEQSRQSNQNARQHDDCPPGDHQADPLPVGKATGPTGRVARYARGRDYHRVMKRQLRSLVTELSARLEANIAARWYVDDGPMLDRAAAARSGLGWFGKNTNLLTTSHGSWVFLGQIITDLDLEPDPPLQKSCGSCARCLPACPTGAIVAPYVIDNARCISYLTIEHRGAIPLELRPQLGDWVFGCDLCQEVCPVNRKAQPAPEPEPPDFQRPELGLLDLLGLLELTDAEFLRRFQGTPIMRAKRVGLQRNACVALGNRGDPAAVPALTRLLQASDEPLLRRHAAWALGSIGGPVAAAGLLRAEATETDPEALDEIQTARRGLRDWPDLTQGANDS